MIEISSIQWSVVVGASLVAAFVDVKARRIPNWLTGPLAVAGLIAALFLGGWRELGSSAAACVVLALPYVFLFVFCGGGAGDAKMMGAIGAWLGMDAGIRTLAAVAAAGGVLGLLNLATKRQLAAGLGRIGASFYVMLIALCSGRAGWRIIKPDPEQSSEIADRQLTIPYGIAIFIGVCIGACWVHPWNG